MLRKGVLVLSWTSEILSHGKNKKRILSIAFEIDRDMFVLRREGGGWGVFELSELFRGKAFKGVVHDSNIKY